MLEPDALKSARPVLREKERVIVLLIRRATLEIRIIFMISFFEHSINVIRFKAG